MKKNIAHAIRVGGSAQTNNSFGDTPTLKCSLSTERATRFGAFAITVSPPPQIAAATMQYFISSPKLGTSDARYVIAALSLNEVSATPAANSAPEFRLCRTG